MIRTPIVVGAICAALLVCSDSWAEQALKDPSTFTCGKWSDVRRADPGPLNSFTSGVTAWMQGYFSGAADLSFLMVGRVDSAPAAHLRAGVQSTIKMLDAEAIPIWIDTYCADHAQEPLGTVAKQLLTVAYGKIGTR